MSPALSSCWIFLAVLFEKLIVPSYTFSVATPVCTRTTGFHREKEIKSKVPAYRRMMHKAPIVTFNMVNDNDSKAKHFCGELKNDHSTSSSRRQVLSSAVGSTASLLALQYLWVRPLFANAMDGNVGTSPDHPVVVVGAGGKVSKIVVFVKAQIITS